MGGVVYIPVQNSEEEVRVAHDQLPRDATDMIDILKAEQAPFHLWLIMAIVFLSAEIDEYYADVKYERIAILNALAGYFTYLGKIESKQRDKEDNFVLTTQYYNRASQIDPHNSVLGLGKAGEFPSPVKYYLIQQPEFLRLLGGDGEVPIQSFLDDFDRILDVE